MENAKNSKERETYFCTLCNMISTCTSDISLILDQGRHYLVTQVHVYNLYRELGNLKYARDEWKFFSEYEDPVRVKTGRDVILQAIEVFKNTYEENKDKLSALFSVDDVRDDFEEATDELRINVGAALTYGYRAKVVDLLDVLYRFIERSPIAEYDILAELEQSKPEETPDIIENYIKEEIVEDEIDTEVDVDDDDTTETDDTSWMLPAGEYFSAEFLSRLLEALNDDLEDNYTVFGWTCIWNLYNVNGPISMKTSQRGPKGTGTTKLYYLIYKMAEHLSKDNSKKAKLWEQTIVAKMGLSWRTYKKGAAKCANPKEQSDKPSYIVYAKKLQEFFKTGGMSVEP
ncbi:MAG: hypothetical protein IKW27_05695 [Bacteroidales bacterium]|nr:hypothetical protein [Bacteroidales bacterium]